MMKNWRTHIQKLEDARNEGNVGKSIEVVGAVLTLGSIYLIFFQIISFWNKKTMQYIYGFMTEELTSATYFTITYAVSMTLMKALMPIFLFIFVIALVGNWMQFGFLSTPLKFDLQKLDPIKGMQNVLV